MDRPPPEPPTEAERKNARHWARVRIDAAIHELHLAQLLVSEESGGFQASQLAHVARQLRSIRERLR
jgi:hypothetical protein